MNQQSIVVNGIAYTHDQIASGEVISKSDFERNTFHFCETWLGGKKNFNLTTSGSSGAPKEMTFTREQMIASARMSEKALGLKSHHTALVCLDTKYIAGQMMLVRCFVIGMNIIALNPSANPLDNIDAKQPIDFAAFVPYQLQSILNSNPEKLNKINVAIIGGAKLDSALRKKLNEVKCQLYATYGMTETVSHVALMKLNGEDPQDYFQALPDVSLKLDNRDCLIVKTGFIKSEVITNDLVELKDSNQFKWLGRWDNIINTGGIKVIPEKVENEMERIFEALKLPNRFFVAGLPDQNLGQKVCLIIEGDNLPEPIMDSLCSKVRSALSRYEVPKEIKFTNKFQETDTGKIKRSETIDLFLV